MAITWGSWSGSTYKAFRCGIDVIISGTSMTIDYWVEADGAVVDNQTLTLTGAVTGTVNFYNNPPSSNRKVKVATRTLNGSRGSTYTFGSKLSGVYSGASPSHSRSVTVPVVITSAPGTPSATSVTHNSARHSWSAPSNNGGNAVRRYQLQRATNSAFTANVVNTYPTGTSTSSTGLALGTTYYWRVRAENSAGWSAWSGTRNATTWNVPNKPANPSITDVTSSGFIVNWVFPGGNGSNPTRMVIQVSKASNFSNPVHNYEDDAPPAGPWGLDRATTYYLRIRARNAAGLGAWSNTITVVTLATVPDKPNAPSVSNVLQTSAVVAVSPASNGGSNITGYKYQIATNSGFTAGVRTFTTGNLTGLIPGTMYYVRYIATNSIGDSAYSDAVFFKTLSGMRLKVSGSWQWAVVKLKVSGTWRQTTVWKKVNGVWRMD